MYYLENLLMAQTWETANLCGSLGSQGMMTRNLELLIGMLEGQWMSASCCSLDKKLYSASTQLYQWVWVNHLES